MLKEQMKCAEASTQFQKRFIKVIISKSSIISTAILDNLTQQQLLQTIIAKQTEVGMINFKTNLRSYIIVDEKIDPVISLPKIDLLIVDYHNDFSKYSHKIKAIVNLTKTLIREDEINMKLPFKLQNLLNIITDFHNQESIFCKINNKWLYDEHNACLLNEGNKIKFTERENQVFKYLLLASAHTTSRDNLLQQVWNYHPEVDSTAIETQLYRLKQKLPENLMGIKDNNYFLTIESVF